MFIGLREQISPTILAVATILVVISIALLLTTVELLRRRSERLRGMSRRGKMHPDCTRRPEGWRNRASPGGRVGAA